MRNIILKRIFLLFFFECLFLFHASLSFAQSPIVGDIRSGIVQAPIGPFKSLADAKKYVENHGILLVENSSQLYENTPLVSPGIVALQPNTTAPAAPDPPACCSGLQLNNSHTQMALGVPYSADGLDTVKEEHVKFLVEIVIVASVLFPVSFAGKSLKFTSLLKYDFIKSILRHIKSSAHIKPSAPFLITRPALRHRRCCSGLLSVP